MNKRITIIVLTLAVGGCIAPGPAPGPAPSPRSLPKAPSSSTKYSLTPVNAITRNEGFSDLGALTWIHDDTYWAASDSGGHVCELTLPVDAQTGRIMDCRLERTLTLENRIDIEGLAFDPLTHQLWAADEIGPVISAHNMRDGKETALAPIPACYKQCRANQSLESLTIREDGLEMWTCNEASLPNDGESSTETSPSLVRLTRFVRAASDSPWELAGQWAYPVGRLHGKAFYGYLIRGVVDLCVLPDGTLLSLEREFSRGLLPKFRCRIYQISFTNATEISAWESLTDKPVVPVKRVRLWADESFFINFEGLCLGKQLNDGSRVVLAVSDGDNNMSEQILSFKLTR